MDINLDAGDKLELEKTVESTDSAKSCGSGLLEVFATPAMIAFMENTAMKLADKGLDPHHGTVGTFVGVSHTRPTTIGMKVKCCAELMEVDKRKLVFKVTAWDEEGEIGTGTHERFVINNEKFMEKLVTK
ncbi:MAG: thioesterase family protein [Bacteriovoracaceae bacterium]|nr:thioesterase family protein [Bacteriovoracaceae bacterium]